MRGKMDILDNKALEEMKTRAKSVCQRAYAPYSKFKVGAVVLTEDGQMFEGCNVENASYGLTICAERNAVFQMAAQGKRKITAVVIYTPSDEPTAPCGACRQVINEFGPNAKVISICDSQAEIVSSIKDMLPQAFGPKNIGR